MLGTLKKIFAFAGNRKGLLKKSLFFSFLNGIFASFQFGALYFIVDALASDNHSLTSVWLALGVLVCGRLPGRSGYRESHDSIRPPTTVTRTPETKPKTRSFQRSRLERTRTVFHRLTSIRPASVATRFPSGGSL